MKFANRFGFIALALSLVVAVLMTSIMFVSAAGHEHDEEAVVVVTLSDMGVEFGGLSEWQASLYAGAEDGAETSGRFTDWVDVEAGVVVFTLPHDVREGNEAPFGVEGETYVRVRSVGDDVYPTFDMVSDPFTLDYALYAVQVGFQGINLAADDYDGTQVMVMVEDLGGDFGVACCWQASLYAGAEAGEETSGRFTDWVDVTDGMVIFTLPDDVREGNEAPFGMEGETYVRVRSAGDDVYPTFDMVGRPFTLVEGESIESVIIITRYTLPR